MQSNKHTIILLAGISLILGACETSSDPDPYSERDTAGSDEAKSTKADEAKSTKVDEWKDPDVSFAKGAAMLETQRTAHDPDSIEVQDCSHPIYSGYACWATTCTVRGKNALGAMVASVTSFSMCRLGEEWKILEIEKP